MKGPVAVRAVPLPVIVDDPFAVYPMEARVVVKFNVRPTRVPVKVNTLGLELPVPVSVPVKAPVVGFCVMMTQV